MFFLPCFFFWIFLASSFFHLFSAMFLAKTKITSFSFFMMSTFCQKNMADFYLNSWAKPKKTNKHDMDRLLKILTDKPEEEERRKKKARSQYLKGFFHLFYFIFDFFWFYWLCCRIIFFFLFFSFLFFLQKNMKHET